MKEMTTTKRVLVVGAANVLLNEEAEVVEVANFSNVSQEHDAAMGTAQGVQMTSQDDKPIAVGEPSLPLQCPVWDSCLEEMSLLLRSLSNLWDLEKFCEF